MSCHKSSKFIVVYSYIRKRRNRPNNISFHLEKEGQNKFKISTKKEIKIKAKIMQYQEEKLSEPYCVIKVIFQCHST